MAVLLIAVPAVEAQRLPATVIPSAYTLKFTPDLASALFEGETEIAVHLVEPTSRIVLHATELDLHEVTVTAGGVTRRPIVTSDEPTQTVTLQLADQLAAGPATLRFTYSGKLNDKLRGFYLSTANNRRYAVTQLQATDARRAFPSFDEPALKATFDITLVIDAGDTAISNGHVLSDTPGPGDRKHTVKFAPTPRMSTYLVAMLVGDFVCRSGSSDGTPIRVCSTPDKLPLTGFALEAAEQQLAFYNRYFGIKYPFGKLDVIGVPDFAAGAMENTAAITFREEYLLADPATATVGAKKTIAGVLSHEIAHMWFGDLVTMAWWDDVWLNEGFASWLANKPLAEWKPEWNIELDNARSTQVALNLDSLQSTRAIHAAVSTPEQINEVFDAIAYEKSAALLRMLERYVGEEAFRRGVQSYLTKYSFKNATSHDFASEIGRASSQPVGDILTSFVNQPGVVLLDVSAACTGSTSVVTVAQRRFFIDPSAAGPPAVWQVPVCFKHEGSSGTACHIAGKPISTIALEGCSTWVLANEGASGYYRVAYDAQAVERLRSVAASLSPVEQLGLLEDEWALVRTGRRPIGDYLNLTTALAGDPTSALMETMASRLAYTGRYLTSAATGEAYARWVTTTFGPLGARLGWTGAAGDSEDRRMSRAAVLYLLGRSGRDRATLDQARSVTDRYLKDPSGIDPDLAETVIELAALGNDSTLYDQYRDRLKSSTDPQEYYRYLQALPRFTSPELVDRTLALTLTPDLRSQDVATLIAGLMTEPDARSRTWQFVTTHWPAFENKLGVFQGLPRVMGAAASFCSVEDQKAVEAFFTAHPVPAAERTLRQVLETIGSCSEIRTLQHEKLAAWLKTSH